MERFQIKEDEIIGLLRNNSNYSNDGIIKNQQEYRWEDLGAEESPNVKECSHKRSCEKGHTIFEDVTVNNSL